MSVVLTGDPLTIGDVVAGARHGETVEVGGKVAARMAPARALVDDVISRGDIVYGITTGFGALAQVHIEPERVVELQHAIVRSHAAGDGRCGGGADPFVGCRIVASSTRPPRAR